MLKYDDIFQIVFFFLLGIFVSCVFQKQYNYEGFEYDPVSYKNDMFNNSKNLDVDGNKSNYDCELFVNRTNINDINDQNGVWWDKLGWYAVIMNDPEAYEEMERDFEADITDPLLTVGKCRGYKKNDYDCHSTSVKPPKHQFFKDWEPTINAIRNKFEVEIGKLYDKIEARGLKESLEDPVFISSVDTKESYLNNFKQTVEVNLDKLAPLNNWDDDSLWKSYRNMIKYIDLIDLSEDDKLAFGDIFAKDDDYAGYYQIESKDKLDTVFPKEWASSNQEKDVEGSSCSGEINGVRYERKGASTISKTEDCPWYKGGWLGVKCTESVTGSKCSIKYRKSLYAKIMELKKFVIRLDIRKVGYMEEYRRLLSILGEEAPKEMIPYLELFQNMLKNVFKVQDENYVELIGDPDFNMIRQWGHWSTTYGLVNNKEISRLYNIPSNKKYDEKCSRKTEEKRCYFNSGKYDLISDKDLGYDVVSDAWGQMYTNYGTRDAKLYFPPYLVQNNKDQITQLETLNERTCNMINPYGGWRYTADNEPGAEKDAEGSGKDKHCYIDGRWGTGTGAQEMLFLPDYKNCQTYSPINEENIEEYVRDIEEYITINYSDLIKLKDNITELEEYVRDKMYMYMNEYNVVEIRNMIIAIIDNIENDNSEGYYNYY